ncbi:MAG: hypothetical protein CM1200mP41_11770 [Gammaproteobacteria bacterium]|nr:MAG: hypothetical protein CM1200mP41_11770 [Gammaproteobacteria bacterium]
MRLGGNKGLDLTQEVDPQCFVIFGSLVPLSGFIF